MRIYTTYCSNRKEHVRLAWVDLPPAQWDEARPGPKDLLCLDAGDACRGPTCHLFSTATIRMAERLQRFQWDG